MSINRFFAHQASVLRSSDTVGLDRRRLCVLAVAGLTVPWAMPLSRFEDTSRIVIRDGWVLLDTDLQ